MHPVPDGATRRLHRCVRHPRPVLLLGGIVMDVVVFILGMAMALAILWPEQGWRSAMREICGKD